MVDVVPLPREIGADVGLVLMVAADHLDLHAVGGRVEILHRELGGGDRAGAADLGVEADMSFKTPILTTSSSCAPRRRVHNAGKRKREHAGSEEARPNRQRASICRHVPCHLPVASVASAERGSRPFAF